MGTAQPNLGAGTYVAVYLESKKLGRDLTQVKNFTVKTTYYEFEVETLGDSPVIPGKRPKGSEGSFEIYEFDADYVDAIVDSITAAELTGTQPKVSIVRRRVSTSGTISKVTIDDCTLTFDENSESKGALVKRGVSFKGGIPRKG